MVQSMLKHTEQTLNYSIHTIELRRSIPLHALGEWKQKLYTLAVQRNVRAFQNADNEHIFYPYIQQGVTIVLYAAQTCGYIKLTISLNSLLYLSPQRVALFYPIDEHIAALDYNLRDILEEALLGSPEKFEFSRVDFSVNTKAQHPRDYILLAYKTGIPRGYMYTYPRFDNPNRQKKINYRYSYDLTRNDGYGCVTLYSKAHQLNDDRYASEMDCAQATGLLRFEVKHDACQLNKGFGYESNTPLSYSPQLLKAFLNGAETILKTTICDLFPAGDYYHLDEAQRIICEQVPSPRNAERLCTWISQASLRQSAYLAKQRVFQPLSGSQRDTLIRLQQQSGINPVTLGRRQPHARLPGMRAVFGAVIE